MAGVDDGAGRRVRGIGIRCALEQILRGTSAAPHQKARDLVNRLLCRGQAHPCEAVAGDVLQALERIGELKIASAAVSVDGNREYNSGWHTALDLHNLLTVSEIVTRAALERKESRGAHFRDDFPAKDDQAGKFNIVARKGLNGEVRLTREPIPTMRPDLQQIVEEMK